jgi:hypothetical protein
MQFERAPEVSAVSAALGSFGTAVGHPAVSMLQPCIVISNQYAALKIIGEMMTTMRAISGILRHDPAHEHPATWSLEQAEWHSFIQARPRDMRHVPMSRRELRCFGLTIVDCNARYLNHDQIAFKASEAKCSR